VVAVLLPLAGIGRRLGYTSLLQLAVVAQLACYALLVCRAPGGAAPAGAPPPPPPGPVTGYHLLPVAYYTVG
jgi:hypothetical protein